MSVIAVIDNYDDFSNETGFPATNMTGKLKTFLKLFAHTLLSFVAALLAGGALYSSFLPILGSGRYHQLAKTPLMWMLLLTGVAFCGAQVFRRWSDCCAFFAWVLPATWVCHLILSRGIEAMGSKWSDPLFWLGIGSAYSVGAFVSAIVAGKIFQKPPAKFS